MTSNRSQNIGLMQDLGHILHNTIKFQLNLFHTWYNASRAWRKGQVIWNHGMSVFILQLNQTKAHMTIKWSLVWSRSLNYAGLHFSQNALLSIQRTLLTLPTYWLEREPRIMLLYVNSPWHYVLHRVRKKRPPKHVQITLWIEKDSHYFSLYHEKPSICNVCVKFRDKQSVHCWDIAFYKKRWSKIAVANIAN